MSGQGHWLYSPVGWQEEIHLLLLIGSTDHLNSSFLSGKAQNSMFPMLINSQKQSRVFPDGDAGNLFLLIFSILFMYQIRLLEDCVLFIILVYPWINLQNCTLALNHQCSLRDLRGSDCKNLLWYSLPDCRECGPPRHNSPSENSLQEAVSGLSTRTLYTSPALFLLHRHVKLCVSFLPYSQKLPSSECDRENKLFF